MKRNIILLLTLFILSACSSEEPEKEEKVRGGEELFTETCGKCHSYWDKLKNNDIPNIGYAKILKKIEAYENGEIKYRKSDERYKKELEEYAKGKLIARPSHDTIDMKERLKDLSKKELKVLAKYIDQLNKGEVKLTPYEVSHKEELAQRKKWAEEAEARLVYLTRKLQPLDKSTKEYKAFKKQKHRFVLNPCAMSYNEKPLWFGMSLEEVYEVLGKENIKIRGYSYYWKDKGVELSFTKDMRVRIVDIYFEKTSYSSFFKKMGDSFITSKSIIILNSVLRPNEKMHKFLEETNFTFKDFSFGEQSTFYTFRYKCQKQRFSYYFTSRIPFKSYSGIGQGHINIRGPFMPKATYRVRKIQITTKEIK